MSSRYYRVCDFAFTLMVVVLAMGGCRPAIADDPPGLKPTQSVKIQPVSEIEALKIQIEGLRSEVKKLTAALDSLLTEVAEVQAKLAAVKQCQCEPTPAKASSKPASKPATPPVKSTSAEPPTIEFYTAKNFVCPPCELWKTNDRPRFLAAGWQVVTFLVESGPTPRFKIKRNGREVEHTGRISVETATSLTN